MAIPARRRSANMADIQSKRRRSTGTRRKLQKGHVGRLCLFCAFVLPSPAHRAASIRIQSALHISGVTCEASQAPVGRQHQAIVHSPRRSNSIIPPFASHATRLRANEASSSKLRWRLAFTRVLVRLTFIFPIQDGRIETYKCSP